MNRSESIAELAAALAKAQPAMRSALKSSDNPFFKSKYADLSAVWEACRSALHANGLTVVQGGEPGDGAHVTVSTMLLHTSGQYIESSLTVRPTKPDPQGIGSAITYARRYALAAIAGVCTEDDDGNAASVHVAPPAAQRATPSNPSNGTSNGTGAPKPDLRKDITVAVKKWTGLQMEDVPDAIKKLKSKCGVTNVVATDTELALMLGFVNKNVGEDWQKVLS